MNDTRVLDNAPWLKSGPTARVLELLDGNGEQARVVGGAAAPEPQREAAREREVARGPVVEGQRAQVDGAGCRLRRGARRVGAQRGTRCSRSPS